MGGMVHPYLRRREGKEDVTYPSAAVKGVLERTLGVSIFQEQVMQLAVVAAGFTPGEADSLRRAMAAWRRRGGIEPFREKLVQGMLARGYAEAYAEQIYQQIQGFGEYGFPESHAASFALLAYSSAWLKCHEPAAFLCGLLNSQPMGFYAAAQLVQDARRHGVEVRPVDVTASRWDNQLEGSAVRLGLREIKGFPRAAAERIAAARPQAPFRDMADLTRRAGLDRRALDLLAAANALASLAGHRRQAAWEASGIKLQGDLFDAAPAPETPVSLPPPREGEELVADYAATGLTLGRHPLALLRPRLAARRFLAAQDLARLEDRALARVAGIVTGRQRPGTASGVIFVTLEDETGMSNVVVYAGLAERQRRPLLGARLLGVYGQLQRDGPVVHLLAKRLVDLSPWLGDLPTASRDFH
jgi:error-prone DNA polymerase